MTKNRKDRLRDIGTRTLESLIDIAKARVAEAKVDVLEATEYGLSASQALVGDWHKRALTFGQVADFLEKVAVTVATKIAKTVLKSKQKAEREFWKALLSGIAAIFTALTGISV